MDRPFGCPPDIYSPQVYLNLRAETEESNTGARLLPVGDARAGVDQLLQGDETVFICNSWLYMIGKKYVFDG